MRSLRLVSLCSTLLSTMMLAQSTSVSLVSQPLVPKRAVANGLSQPDPVVQAKVAESYGKLPLSFEANHGQTDGRVKFLSRAGGYTLFLTRDEAVLTLSGSAAKKPAPKGASGFGGATVSLKRYPDTNPNLETSSNLETNPNAATHQSMTDAVLRMKLRYANPAVKIAGTDELAGTSNYFIGNDPTKWRTNVPTYAKVKYEGIYSGIDLVYYGNQRQLEYDFIVAPGADPRRIAFDVRGAKRIRQDARGDLVLNTGEGEIRWHKPEVYQEKEGERQEIAARYAITDGNRVGFEVARYDASRALYIDPLIYSTYLGGNASDQANAIALDSEGNAYITGYTFSTNFPTTSGAIQTVCGGAKLCGTYGDAFVAKINSAGSALVYSTYIGGSRADDGRGIAVDSAGNAYVTGLTDSTDFPTMNALQPTNGGGFDAFVTKINPTGALIYSTYLGGSAQDQGSAVAVDSAGNAYVTGQAESNNFPTTQGAFQTVCNGGSGCDPEGDAFVSKINPSGSALLYSTYLGGSLVDYGFGIAVDSSGNAYITGFTASADFPTMNPLQAAYAGGYDIFVSKINAAGSALVYSTYLGGSNEEFGNGIAVDGSGSAYVTGCTASTDFPTKNPLQPSYGGGTSPYACGDAFVTKIDPEGSALVYSTYLGGSLNDYGSGIAVDSSGNAYVTGNTDSKNFPAVSLLQKRGGLNDAFIAKLNPAGSALLYSTYLGGIGNDYGLGIAVDSAGDAYVAGMTNSSDFPTKNPLQAAKAAGNDAFVAKISYAPTTTQLTSSVNPSVSGKAVIFAATVSSSSGGTPTGMVTFLDATTVLGKKALSGGVARLSTSILSPGSHSISAYYGGDSNFTASTSAPVNQFVLAATTNTLSSSSNPSIYGQAVTFTAVLTSAIGPPPDGETVTFMKGTKVLGTGTLSGGSASFTTSTLPVGTSYIKAVYGGDSNFAGSKSKAVTQVVN
jgi:hypothetical protein